MQDRDGDLFDLEAVLDRARSLGAARMVVVRPYDRATLESVYSAAIEGIVEPLLVGRRVIIQELVENLGIKDDYFRYVDEEEDRILERAASLIHDGEADFVMKGMVRTGDFIHVLLDPRWKIRTEKLLSHVGMHEIPQKKRLFLMSDGAINIVPNFSRKIHIVRNAVEVARKLGMWPIRIAMLAAVEKVKLPAMPATLDAFLMKKFSESGYFGDCEIDGPFALDNALDPESAAEKGITGNVAGNANILIVPNIETGNVLWKTLTCLEKKEAAGVVVGGSCPIVVPSRSDTKATKLLSIKFARLLLG
jgi:phosphate butyryltransferase